MKKPKKLQILAVAAAAVSISFFAACDKPQQNTCDTEKANYASSKNELDSLNKAYDNQANRAYAITDSIIEARPNNNYSGLAKYGFEGSDSRTDSLKVITHVSGLVANNPDLGPTQLGGSWASAGDKATEALGSGEKVPGATKDVADFYDILEECQKQNVK
ncbi:MAG: hypothetical protein LBN95_11300 [Prevotellaceae bacterium]|jgi:hypothetical protein|nr:hypothetical protein [Prevotellaceae bacterium]